MQTSASAVCLAVTAGVVLSPQLLAAESIADAFTNGNTDLSFRLRFEDVKDDSVRQDANAFTLKSRLTFTTDSYKGLSLLAEFDDVTELNEVDYDNKVNGLTHKAVIADPEGTEINQVYLAYQGVPDTVIKLGNQRILLDNQRFVGGVGFRQNEQTFDSVTVTNTSLADTELFYGYIQNVNTILGGNEKHDTHLVNISYSSLPLGKLTAYYYGFKQDMAGGYDLDTYGLRLAGSQPSGQLKLLYAAEYATQDAGTNTPDYYLLEGGAAVSGVTAKVGYEVLDSDNGTAFNTPLATKHKFQGWADQFLVTPADGIEDLYLTIGTNIADIDLLGVFHDFESSQGSTDLGSEWGLSAGKKFGKHYGLSLKYANYQAGDAASGKADLSKLWLTANASF